MFERFTLIAGPCVLEEDDLNLEIGKALATFSADLDLPIIFKASYDKANRSKADSPRGPGLEAGLERLARVKAETGLSLITDIHEPYHAAKAAEVVDVIQIPAFLCRQTDLLVAAGRQEKTVSIKKGQWMAPEEMVHAVDKTRRAGASEVVVTERGTFFGYGNLVVDFRSLPRMRALGHPVILDATHSVQRPGALGDRTGGDRTEAPILARAAMAVGADGLFMEVHEDPDRAKSDGPNQLRLQDLAGILAELHRLWEAAR